jgi:hypothetical protein
MVLLPWCFCFTAAGAAESFGNKEPYDIDPGVCKDVHPNCQDWAKAGECDNNAGFMVRFAVEGSLDCY